jgi:hypothetical protein
MKRTVKLFVIPKGHGTGAPESGTEFTVEGLGFDELRHQVQAHLGAKGLRVRSVNFASDGMLAYAEVRP